MAARDDHLQQARDNRAFAQSLLRDRSVDAVAVQWAVIATFYSAVHCMEAHFTAFNLAHQSHQARLLSMAAPQYAVSGTAYLAYQRLLRASMACRYYLYRPSSREARDLLETYLVQVSEFVKLDEQP